MLVHYSRPIPPSFPFFKEWAIPLRLIELILMESKYYSLLVTPLIKGIFLRP